MAQSHSRVYQSLGFRISSPIQTITVGSGITPDQLPLEGTPSKALAGSTAGGDFHPALKNRLFSLYSILHPLAPSVKS